MKCFKIVNLLVFLFVINLSITFLDNNLLATFINGVLQTDNKNLYQRNQKSLAELEDFSDKCPYTDPYERIQDYIDKFFKLDLLSFSDMACMISSAKPPKHVMATNISHYTHFYSAHASMEGVNIVEEDIECAFDRYLKYILLFPSLLYIPYDMCLIKDKIKTIQITAKHLILLFISESNVNLKKEILSADYIKKFVISNHRSNIPESNINSEHVILLINNLITKLKQEKLIS